MVTVFSNGVKIINCTPHEIRFLDESGIVVVQPSGYKINATASETIMSECPCKLVKTAFIKSNEGLAEIKAIRAEYKDVLIVGSIISAQAYPGEVVGMTPAEGYERVAPAGKLMSVEKFTIF